jgi:hypothetical protein
MKRALVLGLVAAMLLPAIAEARGSRKGGSGLNQHDTSQDFGKHFDDEVKYERDHPKDDDGSPAPKKKRKSSRRKKSKATAENSEAI